MSFGFGGECTPVCECRTDASVFFLYFALILLNPVCNIETRELALSETKLRMSGNLPVGEPGYQTYKCPRAPGVTSLYGVDFRHVRQKGPKSLPEGSLAPLEGYPSRAADTTIPLFWQDGAHLRVPDSRSRQHLDLDCLERHAPDAIIKVSRGTMPSTRRFRSLRPAW